MQCRCIPMHFSQTDAVSLQTEDFKYSLYVDTRGMLCIHPEAAWREGEEKQFKAVSTMLIKQMETLARREATVETMKASTLAELQKETPEGWTCHFSNTTGQIYFWHVEREFSQFELPTYDKTSPAFAHTGHGSLKASRCVPLSHLKWQTNSN